MKFILGCLLLCAAVCYVQSAGTTCNCGWLNKGRIVGGKEAPKNKYPLIAALERRRNSFHFCGGAIVTPWHVVTAAHCTYKKIATDLQVRVGAHNLKNSGQVYGIAKYINHEKYDDDKVIYDLSILVTESQMAFNQVVGPVCLPSGKLSLVGQKVNAMGWGLTTHKGVASKDLLEVELDVIPFAQCVRAWRHDPPFENMNLCTYTRNKDTCQGDSGGPLIWLDKSINRYVLAAVVSYGNVCAGHLPGVYTDVSLFLDWINSKIAATKPGIGACRKV